MIEDYAEAQERLKQEQEGKSKEEIMQLMREQSESAIDLDALKNQNDQHKWVDRGAVISCEAGSHPPHRHFKR